MTRQLTIRPEGRADLVAIAEFVGNDSVERARKLIERLRRRCEVLVDHPFAGRPRSEFGDGIRSLAERPYVIFYRVLDQAIEIIAFAHGARDLPSVLRDRFEKDLD